MSTDYGDALRVVIQAVRRAGNLLRAEFQRPGGPRGEDGHAEADGEAERIIRHELLDAYPHWGYLGEETGRQDGAPGERHVWLVDPNDGTRGFLKGSRGSAVSVALVRDGVLVLGVVYAFAAPDSGGDLIAWAEGCGPIARNGHPVPPHGRGLSSDGPGLVLLSQGADNRPHQNAILVGPARYRAMPSIAYRLALAAVGERVVAVSISAPGAWDYAGGHTLVAASGGAFVNERDEAVSYSPRGDSRVGACFGGDPEMAHTLAARDWSTVWEMPRRPRERYDLVRLEPGRNVGDAALLRRAQGCLLGLLAGDGLGSLVEFQPAPTVAERYPRGLRQMEDGGTWTTIAGQPTDAGEMALMLARAIVEARGHVPEEAAQAYAVWYRSRPFDCGVTTRQALAPVTDSDLRQRRAAERARDAASRESQTNGSLMRLAPLGIWGYDLPAAVLAEHARANATLTHPNAVCQEAAALFAVAVASAVRHGASAEEVYEHALAWAEAECREAVVTDAVRRAQLERPDYDTRMTWVLVALQNAFYRLLHAPTFEDVVTETVAAGGDTDTNAAVAGALAGAVHGREAVPVAWRDAVLTCRPIEGLPGVAHPRPPACWPVDALDLAERLLLAGR